jgi:hypothetical protein
MEVIDSTFALLLEDHLNGHANLEFLRRLSRI